MSEPGEYPPAPEAGGFMVPPPLMEQMIKNAATFEISRELLDDYAGFDISDWLGGALRGEIKLNPPPEPRYHRCLACWLISLLPGHDRCQHGRLGCGTCESDY